MPTLPPAWTFSRVLGLEATLLRIISIEVLASPAEASSTTNPMPPWPAGRLIWMFSP